MAFTGDFLCQSFKVECLTATHDFSVAGNTFKFAMYTASAAFDATTSDYTVTNEITNDAGTAYTAGGGSLTNALDPEWNSTGGTKAITDFDDEVWGTATFTAYGGMIYNSTAGTNAVCILDFTAAKTATAGDFTVIFPAADAATAIIRIA